MGELARRLKEVDPHLTVITGGVRRRTKRSPLGNWERTKGVECPECKGETLRLINDLCPRCSGDAEAKRAEGEGEERMRRYYKDKLRKGEISITQMREGRL